MFVYELGANMCWYFVCLMIVVIGTLFVSDQQGSWASLSPDGYSAGTRSYPLQDVRGF